MKTTQKLSQSQNGMAGITGILIVILVAAIAGVGWYVYTNNQVAKTEDGGASQSAPVSNAEAPAINTASDLDKASEALDGQNVDKNLDSSSLDADVDSLF